MKNKYTLKINFLDIAFILFYAYDLILYFFIQVFPNYQFSKIISLIILYVVLILGIIREKRALKIDSILLIVGLYLLFLLNSLLYPNYRYAMFELPIWNIYSCVFTFSSSIFAYLFFRLINNPKRMLNNLKKASYLTFLWSCLRIYSAVRNGGFNKAFENGVVSTSTYDMAVGYRLLFSSIIFFIIFCGKLKTDNNKTNKISYLILFVISLVLMIIYGPRSSVASFVLFLVLYLFFIGSNRTSKNLVRKLFIIIFLFSLYLFFKDKSNLTFIYNALSKFNLNSRILNSLISGSVELDFGRNMMWKNAIKLILMHPLIGNGIYVDRSIYGIYCHQFVLEMLLNFGVVLGLIIIFIFIKNIINMLFLCKNEIWKLIFIVFLSMTLIRLNISSSFWQDTNFWACIAIVVNYHEDSKLNKKNIN